MVTGATAVAQIAQYCPTESGGVCYRLNVPEQTASTGNGDIFFQIQGPSTKSWIAVGQGTGMAGADIFVVYADASGKNVTLSPRLGKGHVQPLFNSKAQAFLIGGSGISNGLMTANIRCMFPKHILLLIEEFSYPCHFFQAPVVAPGQGAPWTSLQMKLHGYGLYSTDLLLRAIPSPQPWSSTAVRMNLDST